MVAAAAAVAVVAVIIAAPGSPGAKSPRTGSTAATPTTQLTLAARVLGDASVAVAARPVPQLDPHQWIYAKSVSYTFGQGTATDEYWIRFDGSQSAYIGGGKLIMHTAPQISSGGATALDRYDANTTLLSACEALASLPSSTPALLAAIDKQIAAVGPGSVIWFSIAGSQHARSKGELEFDYLSQLLWNAYADASPVAEASVYRALATIPNVSIQSGITNVVGRPAIGVSPDGGATQLLLDPHSYQVIGMRAVSTGPNPTGAQGSWPKKGEVAMSLAWSPVRDVSAPGRR